MPGRQMARQEKQAKNVTRRLQNIRWSLLLLSSEMRPWHGLTSSISIANQKNNELSVKMRKIWRLRRPRKLCDRANFKYRVFVRRSCFVARRHARTTDRVEFDA